MKSEIRARLRALNRDFYRRRASEFSDTRDHPWPGWERVVTGVLAVPRPAESEPLRVLDVGCGNGRFALYLAEAWNGQVAYHGLDASAELLAVAAERTRDLGDLETTLDCLDVLGEPVGEGLPEGPYDLVAAFGLLHHVPGARQREALVYALAQRVSSGGWLAISAWQFGRSERMLRRVIPWEAYPPEDPIDSAELEPGDHLLSFGDRTEAPRYCHHCDTEELDALARAPEPATGWRLERFDADGRSGDLNHYLVFHRGG